MEKLKVLFADDLIPDQALMTTNSQNGFCEITMQQHLKKQHPNWSPKFIKESMLMYHAVNTLCCANVSVAIANKYNDVKNIIQASQFDVAIIDLGWHSDESIPSDQRSYAGWKLCEFIENLNRTKEHNKTIIILYSSRIGKDPSIYIHATVRGILPVYKTRSKSSFEALKSAVKFIERYIFNHADGAESELSRLSSSKIHSEKINILFLAADPTNATRLRLGQEHREIQEKLQIAKQRNLFHLEERMAVRPQDLTQALLDTEPQIVHFSGHGIYNGALCFEDEMGITHPIEPSGLAALFEHFSGMVQCVILNACYSEMQAKAIVKHIDYVIGMKQEVADKAAIAFAVGFYQGLGAGLDIDDAYQLGCVQIKLQEIQDDLIPVLLKKNKCPDVKKPHRCTQRDSKKNFKRLFSRNNGNGRGIKKFDPIYN